MKPEGGGGDHRVSFPIEYVLLLPSRYLGVSNINFYFLPLLDLILIGWLLKVEVYLPACQSLTVDARDRSWRGW